MRRVLIIATLALLPVGCENIDGVIHVGSDPHEGSDYWDGDVDRVRWEKERARHEAAREAPKTSE